MKTLKGSRQYDCICRTKNVPSPDRNISRLWCWHVTWWGGDQRAYDLIEHPALVAAAERGASEGEAQQSLIDAGWSADYVSSLYWGGWLSAAVVEVNYPYIVQEYDGMETVLEKETAPWRT